MQACTPVFLCQRDVLLEAARLRGHGFVHARRDFRGQLEDVQHVEVRRGFLGQRHRDVQGVR